MVVEIPVRHRAHIPGFNKYNRKLCFPRQCLLFRNKWCFKINPTTTPPWCKVQYNSESRVRYTSTSKNRTLLRSSSLLLTILNKISKIVITKICIKHTSTSYKILYTILTFGIILRKQSIYTIQLFNYSCSSSIKIKYCFQDMWNIINLYLIYCTYCTLIV